MQKKRAAKLTAKKNLEIKDHLRKYLPKNCYEQLAELFSHINWLEDDRLKLERELREKTQGDLFKEKKPIELPPGIEVPPECDVSKPKAPRAQRLYEMFKVPGAIEGYIKWAQKHESIEDLRKEANIWAFENERAEV